MKKSASLIALAYAAGIAAVPAILSTEPDPSLAFSTTLNNQSFINKGLVAFGFTPSNFKESTGDTLGGIGSAIALKRGSFKKSSDGSYKGTIVGQPDRGFNVDHTVDYQARQHEIDFVLKPYYNVSPLTFGDAQQTLQLTYRKTLLYKDRLGKKTSGLDPLGVRVAEFGYPNIAISNPVVPIANKTYSHLSIDAEGLVLNADGTFWVSDEYGPYVYRFDPLGNLIQVISPPEAIIPHTNGTVNFTSESGFECLTLDEPTNTLWVMLQSAAIQDGGTSKATSRYTRLLAYNVAHPLLKRPELKAEYIVPLPQNSKGNTLAASEIHFVSKDVFLVLSRDGDGHGGDDTKSKYKSIDLVTIGGATDIHGSKFDSPQYPIAVNGILDSTITPATYIPFVNILNSTQLSRFGLHNGDPADATLIDGKWESIDLAPVGDPNYPHDYFLFTAADNDFITTQGISIGEPYNAGLDNDNQFLVYRVTLPTK